MKDELEFILKNYGGKIYEWLLDTIIPMPDPIPELGVSFFSDSEKYVDSKIKDLKGILNYPVKNNNFSASHVNVTFFQDFSIGDDLLTDITYCTIDNFKFVKIITPFTRDRSYDLIIALRNDMSQILIALNAKQEASNFDPDSIPVVGMDFSELKKNTIDFLLNEDFRTFCKKHYIPLKRGVVLEGKPGTGKTLSLRWLKERALKNKIHFQNFESPKEFLDDKDRYFEDGKKIFVFEDFDTSLIDRGKTGDTPNAILGLVLNTLEGINQIHDTVSIFTTNKISVFDSAFMRPGRIDKVLTYQLPNKNNIEKFIDIYLKDLDKEMRTSIVNFIVNKNTDISYAVLKGICDDISIHIFNEGNIDIKNALKITLEKLTGANKTLEVKDTKEMVI